ncbi:universal stress protein [Desulfitibacter alkalitolerans]|uniref:universal stress protein n=1 Tax=Desulfitibacter alkalitolerans TaxID=264641 RepID=UPI000485E197|nr:universal stress protein [Desulfitibacter alkalitolerans]
MFEKILFPTTGSRLSEKISNTIVGLIKEKPDREVTILHVLEKYDMPAEVEYEIVSRGHDFEEMLSSHVKECIQKSTKVFRENGIPYKVRIKRGDPVKVIIKISEEMCCDLMIIGYHGETTLTELIFKGNTMARLIDNSPCPVMVIK